MDELTLEIIALFEREPLFMELDREYLVDIATRFQRVRLPRNTVVYSQGAPTDCFYIVFNGHVRVTHSMAGEEHLLNVLGTGDYFGEQELFSDQSRRTTVTTIESSMLLRLLPEDFSSLLEDYPQIHERLYITAHSRKLAYAKRFSWLGTDEVVYFLERKHPFFLYLSLLLPVLLFVASFPVLAIAIFFTGAPTVNLGILALGTVMALAGIAWFGWNWIDWSNDFYIITNQRVVWVEKLVIFYDSRREAPLDTILSVNVSSSLVGRLVRYGDVMVRTFTGSIIMRKMPNPHAFESLVRSYQKRVLVLTAEEEKQLMERELDQALRRKAQNPFDIPIILQPLRTGKPKAPTSAGTDVGLIDFIKTFTKVRYEKDGVITYRKHWLLLLQKAWLPVFVLILLIGSTVGLLFLEISEAGFQIIGTSFLLIGGLIYFIILLWLLYYVLDWANDIYRLTPTQILDIERKPLGDEMKKSAPLESILSLEHEYENIIQKFFNFGYVTINIGQTKFIFRGVHNPDHVHQDISDYREVLLRKKKEAEAAKERQRMINWFVTYNEQTADQEFYENPDEDSDLLG